MGHSMGAAIAMIVLAEYATDLRPIQFQCYAFALPRFSDKVVAAYFDSYLDFIIVNNGDDIVTKAHLYVAECAYVSKCILLLSPERTSMNILHHSMDEYISNIKLLYQNVDILSHTCKSKLGLVHKTELDNTELDNTELDKTELDNTELDIKKKY
jgi:hypothetical protein